MPVPLLEALIEAMPRLQAEEATTYAAAVAAGSGKLTDEGKAAWAALVAPAYRQAPAEAPARPGKRRVPVEHLAAMHTSVVIAPRRKG